MNRILQSTIAIGGVFFFSLSALAMSPTIRGSVLRAGTQQGISGVDLQLYVDDGDGSFTSADLFTGAVATTDAGGAYLFDQLDADASFFVVQPTQDAEGMSAPRAISAIQAPSRARFLIDAFDITQSVVVNPISMSRSNSVIGPGTSILGGERDAYLQFRSGIADAKLRVNPYSLGSSLQFDVAAGVSGMAVVTWDGLDNSASMTPSLGLNGMDLTDGGVNDGLAIRMAIDKAGEGQTVKLSLFSGDLTSSVEVPIPVTATVDPTGVVFIAFDEFVGGASASSVDAIQLMIDAKSPSIDARIDEIGVVGPSEANFNIAVPEPATLIMLLTAVASLAVVLRRRY